MTEPRSRISADRRVLEAFGRPDGRRSDLRSTGRQWREGRFRAPPRGSQRPHRSGRVLLHPAGSMGRAFDVKRRPLGLTMAYRSSISSKSDRTDFKGEKSAVGIQESSLKFEGGSTKMCARRNGGESDGMHSGGQFSGTPPFCRRGLSISSTKDAGSGVGAGSFLAVLAIALESFSRPAFSAPESGAFVAEVENGAVIAEVEHAAPALSLRDALARAVEYSPELASFSWEIRAREAHAIQTGLLPNPFLVMEIEDFAGSGPSHGFAAAQIVFFVPMRMPTIRSWRAHACV